MSSNRLSLNPTKTKLTWFGTRQQLAKIDYSLLDESFPSYAFSTADRNLVSLLIALSLFSDHITNLTRSCYYHLRRLKPIRSSVSSLVFTSIVHAYIFSRIDYCNSLFVGLPIKCASPICNPFLIRAAARLIARLPRFSNISTFMFEQIHWLPLTARTQLKVLILICRSYLGIAPKYVCDSIRRPTSAASLRPLHSSGRLDLLFFE